MPSTFHGLYDQFIAFPFAYPDLHMAVSLLRIFLTNIDSDFKDIVAFFTLVLDSVTFMNNRIRVVSKQNQVLLYRLKIARSLLPPKFTGILI